MRAKKEQNIDAIIRQLGQATNMATEAYTLSRGTALQQSQLSGEIRGMQVIVESSVRSLERLEDNLAKIDEKISVNLRWSIATILSAMIAIGGLVLSLLR